VYTVLIRPFPVIVTLWLLAFCTSVFAESANPLLITMSPEIRIVERHGKDEQVRYVPARKVEQGQEIYYTVRIVNASNEKVRHATVVQTVPANTSLVEKSVTGAGAALTYSIDGGKNFITLTELRNVSATVTPRVTHIRWQFRHSLAPHVTVLARFCAVFD